MNNANRDKMFQCKFCNYDGTTGTQLKKHIERIHDRITRYKCDYCHWTFWNIYQVKVHINLLHHENRPFKCDVCSYSTVTISLLKTHKKQHSKLKPYKCEKCPYAAPSNSKLKRHQAVHENQKPDKKIQCKFCDYSTHHFINYLNRHVEKSHDRIVKYKCDTCDRAFNSNYQVMHHLKLIHLGNNPFKCDVCSYSTISASHLKQHRDRHSQAKLYECEKCSYASNSKYKLHNHHRIIHNKTMKRYKCSYCTYSTIYLGSYTAHQNKKVCCRVPKSAKEFKCDECSYETNWKDDLRRHKLRKHIDIKSAKEFKCDECSYETNWKDDLRKHKLRKHIDIKSAKEFKCDECSYETNWKDDVRKHKLRKHIDVKPFRCNVCSYETKSSWELKIHHGKVHAKDRNPKRLQIEEHSKNNVIRWNHNRSARTTDHEVSVEQNFIANSTSVESSSSNSILSPSLKYFSSTLDEKFNPKADDVFPKIDIKQETELPNVKRNQSKVSPNKNSANLKTNFGKHQLNEKLSSVKVKQEVQSSDLMQNYSYNPQNVKIENVNAWSDTFIPKQFDTSQAFCKLEIKKEKNENGSKLSDIQVAIVPKPIRHKNNTDYCLFDRFHLKHLKIIIENNLNVIINQHIEALNRN